MTVMDKVFIVFGAAASLGPTKMPMVAPPSVTITYFTISEVCEPLHCF